MKKAVLWKILLLVGICPFVLPFLTSVTKMSTWTLMDWLIMYSYVYWPTYIFGAAWIALCAYKLVKAAK